MEEEFLLKWHDHHTSFFLLVEELVTRLVGRSVGSDLWIDCNAFFFCI